MNYELFKGIRQLAGHHPILDGFMVFISEKSLIIYAIAFILMWIFGNEKYKKTIFFATITGFLGLFLNLIISYIYFEPRPFVTHSVNVLINHAADASFPSDHTTGAFSLALAVFLRQRKIGVGMLLFAVLTGVSRIYVGHHYPIDILGSIVVAVLVSVLIYKISPFLEPVSRTIINIYNRIPFVPKEREKSNMQ
ncbi:undecaprenyl-diphosphatase [Lentibacillus sp. N15]|uniref:undecaprenyl-diphosphatase n=1 Tax=Lentibacillus songyuanensis TaxID=3136161 RepID=UPI0031BABA6B